MATNELNARTTRALNDLKRPFMSFVEKFSTLATSRAELAPRFMQVYGQYLQQTGGSFVDFVRRIDPDVPADRAAYRAHRSFQAADYLRRLVARRDVGSRRAKPVRSNLTIMARLLATIVPAVNNADEFWAQFGSEFGLTARQIGKLRQVVASQQPVLRLPLARPIRAQIVHVATEQENAQAATARRRAA